MTPFLTDATYLMEHTVITFHHFLAIISNNNVLWPNVTLATLTFASCILLWIHLVSYRPSIGWLPFRCCGSDVVLLWYVSSILQWTHFTILSRIFVLVWSAPKTFACFCILERCCVCSFSTLSPSPSATLSAQLAGSKIPLTHWRKTAALSSSPTFHGGLWHVTLKSPCETCAWNWVKRRFEAD